MDVNQNVKPLTKFRGEDIDGANKNAPRAFKIGIVNSGELIHEFKSTLWMSQFFNHTQNDLDSDVPPCRKLYLARLQASAFRFPFQ